MSVSVRYGVSYEAYFGNPAVVQETMIVLKYHIHEIQVSLEFRPDILPCPLNKKNG